VQFFLSSGSSAGTMILIPSPLVKLIGIRFASRIAERSSLSPHASSSSQRKSQTLAHLARGMMHISKGSVSIKPHGASVAVTEEVWHDRTSIA